MYERRAVRWSVVARASALYQRFLPQHGKHAFVWKYSQAIGGRRPRHFHSEPELNLVVRGSASFGMGDRTVTASAGELVVFPSGQDHVLLEASDDLYLYAIGLDSAYSADVLRGEQCQLVPLHVRLGKPESSVVLDRASAIVDRSGADQLGAELWERLHWLGRRSGERLGGVHVLTRRALRLMSSAPELGLNGLASDLAVHPSELSRHFHRDMGVTLVRHRMRLRLLEVIRLVNSGERDVMAAASAAGFGSYSQCHRVFHAELGCSPRQFFFDGMRDQMQATYAGFRTD
jgi:AraC-like DNA-binding protein/quercetin dioxygenase-like cupin family protein